MNQKVPCFVSSINCLSHLMPTCQTSTNEIKSITMTISHYLWFMMHDINKKRLENVSCPKFLHRIFSGLSWLSQYQLIYCWYPPWFLSAVLGMIIIQLYAMICFEITCVIHLMSQQQKKPAIMIKVLDYSLPTMTAIKKKIDGFIRPLACQHFLP